jgi:hypothetical protein
MIPKYGPLIGTLKESNLLVEYKKVKPMAGPLARIK